MTLGTALFASVVTSVVLVLAVYHKPFRKVFFWVAGISVLGAGIFFLSAHLYRKHEARKQADREGKFKACVARFPVPYVLDGERMSRLAIASACERNPDFAPVQNSSYLANIVLIHGGCTLKITPAQWCARIRYESSVMQMIGFDFATLWRRQSRRSKHFDFLSFPKRTIHQY